MLWALKWALDVVFSRHAKSIKSKNFEHYVWPGLEKSAAIRPFATKKSRLASEKILLLDSLATESYRLADRLATWTFFQSLGEQHRRRCGPNLIAKCVAVFVDRRCKALGRLGPCWSRLRVDFCHVVGIRELEACTTNRTVNLPDAITQGL